MRKSKFPNLNAIAFLFVCILISGCKKDSDRGLTGATGSQGPVGPAGPTGPQGIQGLSGTPGSAGGLLAIKDNSGNTVAYLLGILGTQFFPVMLTEGRMAVINIYTGEYQPQAPYLFYTGANCSGEIYANPGPFLNGLVYQFQDGNYYRTVAPLTSASQVTYASFKHGSTPSCTNQVGTYSGTVWSMEQTISPFDFSTILPLKVTLPN